MSADVKVTVLDLDAIRRAQNAMVMPEADAWAVLAPLVDALPSTWRTLQTAEDGASFQHKDGRRVVVSVARHEDDRRWLHASVSRRGKLPSYEDLCTLHREFIGPERRAVQVFAPEKQHVNLHPTCLHLWCCLDGDGMPDFTAGTGSV